MSESYGSSFYGEDPYGGSGVPSTVDVTVSAPSATATASAPVPSLGLVIFPAAASATASAPAPTLHIGVDLSAPIAAAYAFGQVPVGGTVSGPAISVRAFSGTAPGVPIAILNPDVKDRTWLDQLNEVGSASLKIHKLDDAIISAPSLLDYDTILRFALNGTDRFAAIIENRSLPPAPVGEYADQWWTLSGRGVLALLEDAIAYPEAGWENSTARDRSFGWMAIAYDDSAWTAAVEIQRQDAGTPVTDYAKLPTGWPDPLAYWIWSRGLSGGAMPAGTSYFRTTFTLADGIQAGIHATCDNTFRLWLDDEVVIDTFPHGDWSTLNRIDRPLGPGIHQLAVEGLNDVPPGASYGVGPAAVLVSVIEVDSKGALTTNIVARSDSSWVADDYPASVPGMTIGQILLVLINEAQARGALTGITPLFDATNDSGGTAWPVIPDIAVQIGTNYLDILRPFIEQHIDARMTPALELQAYVKGTMGSDLTGSVSLLVGQDFESLGADGQGHVSNVVLARDQNNELWERTDATSLGSRKRREAYLELATAPSSGRVQIITDSVFSEFAGPSVQLPGRVALAAGAYTVWGPADTILAPNMFDAQVASNVLSITVSEDPATGQPFLDIEFSQDDV